MVTGAKRGPADWLMAPSPDIGLRNLYCARRKHHAQRLSTPPHLTIEFGPLKGDADAGSPDWSLAHAQRGRRGAARRGQVSHASDHRPAWLSAGRLDRYHGTSIGTGARAHFSPTRRDREP